MPFYGPPLDRATSYAAQASRLLDAHGLDAGNRVLLELIERGATTDEAERAVGAGRLLLQLALYRELGYSQEANAVQGQLARMGLERLPVYQRLAFQPQGTVAPGAPNPDNLPVQVPSYREVRVNVPITATAEEIAALAEGIADTLVEASGQYERQFGGATVTASYHA